MDEDLIIEYSENYKLNLANDILNGQIKELFNNLLGKYLIRFIETFISPNLDLQIESLMNIYKEIAVSKINGINKMIFYTLGKLLFTDFDQLLKKQSRFNDQELVNPHYKDSDTEKIALTRLVNDIERDLENIFVIEEIINNDIRSNSKDEGIMRMMNIERYSTIEHEVDSILRRKIFLRNSKKVLEYLSKEEFIHMIKRVKYEYEQNYRGSRKIRLSQRGYLSLLKEYFDLKISLDTFQKLLKKFDIDLNTTSIFQELDR